MNRSSSLVRRNIAKSEQTDEARQILRDEYNAEEEEPLASSNAAETIAGKRKKPEYQPGRFKAVSQLVMAMNRFKASLNPTYTFGKRAGVAGSGVNSPDSTAQDFNSALVNEPEATPPIRRAYSSRGNRTKYLLTSLPPAAGEVKAAS